MRDPARSNMSSVLLAAAGAIIIGMGAYFMFLRPPLLPEDFRYLRTTPEQLQMIAPRLTAWLTSVFRVVGGYMAGSGILTVYVAATSFRTGGRIAMIVVAVAGLVTIGLMASINFLIDSEFKWFLAGIAALWFLALAAGAWLKR
jgi:hypothetical protein